MSERRIYTPYQGTNAEDQRMMQEVLELLARDSGEDSKDELSADSDMDASSHCDGSGCDNANCRSCGGEHETEGNPSAMSAEAKQSRGGGNCGEGEEASVADQPRSADPHEVARQHPSDAWQTQLPSGVHPMLHTPTIMDTSLYSTLPLSTAPHIPVVSEALYYQPQLARVINPAWNQSVAALSSQLFVAPPLPVAPLRTTISPLPATMATTGASAAASNALLLGIHELSDDQFDDMKRRLRMQVTSRRYRRRKKDEQRDQRLQVQRLEAELAHLRSLASQAPTRSTAAMQAELAAREQDVARLSDQLRCAARDEIEWVQKHMPNQ